MADVVKIPRPKSEQPPRLRDNYPHIDLAMYRDMMFWNVRRPATAEERQHWRSSAQSVVENVLGASLTDDHRHQLPPNEFFVRLENSLFSDLTTVDELLLVRFYEAGWHYRMAIGQSSHAGHFEIVFLISPRSEKRILPAAEPRPRKRRRK